MEALGTAGAGFPRALTFLSGLALADSFCLGVASMTVCVLVCVRMCV